MFGKALIVLLFAFFTTASKRYKASVVEYHHLTNPRSSDYENLLKNTQIYTKIIRVLDPMVDIVVFPEHGLVGKMTSDSIFIQVPDPSWNRLNTFNIPVLSMLSTAAMTQNVYVVVNLYEKYRSLKYSTNVVFRRNGTIAARYRKTNIVGESFLHAPADPNPASFDTDFEITFGMFISYDILYQKPAQDLVKQGITDFVYSTHWFSEYPFLTALQVQKGWAAANKINLLASGYNNVSSGSMGSGIYSNAEYNVKKETAYTNSNFTHVMNNRTFIITRVMVSPPDNYVHQFSAKPINQNISEVRIDSLEAESRFMGEKTQANNFKMNLGFEDLSEYRKSDLGPYSSSDTTCDDKTYSDGIACKTDRTVCHNSICCHFNVTMAYYYAGKDGTCDYLKEQDELPFHFNLYPRKLVAFGGRKNLLGSVKIGQDVCGLITCANEKCNGMQYFKRIEPVHGWNGYLLCHNKIKKFSLERETRDKSSNGLTIPSILLTTDFRDEYSVVLDDTPSHEKKSSVSLQANRLQMTDGHAVGTAALITRIHSKDSQLPSPPKNGLKDVWYTGFPSFPIAPQHPRNKSTSFNISAPNKSTSFNISARNKSTSFNINLQGTIKIDFQYSRHGSIRKVLEFKPKSKQSSTMA